MSPQNHLLGLLSILYHIRSLKQSMLMIKSTAVIAAGMAIFMVMVVVMVAATGVGIKDKSSFSEGLGSNIRKTGNAAVDLNAGLGKGHPGTAADTAADQRLDTMAGQKAGQGTVAAFTAADDFGGDDLAVFDGVDLKGGSVAEMLEDETVFVSDGKFHGKSLLM